MTADTVSLHSMTAVQRQVHCGAQSPVVVQSRPADHQWTVACHCMMTAALRVHIYSADQTVTGREDSQHTISSV